eukprot:8858637-Pyramimonas_sp.AAC.1
MEGPGEVTPSLLSPTGVRTFTMYCAANISLTLFPGKSNLKDISFPLNSGDAWGVQVVSYYVNALDNDKVWGDAAAKALQTRGRPVLQLSSKLAFVRPE